MGEVRGGFGGGSAIFLRSSAFVPPRGAPRQIFARGALRGIGTDDFYHGEKNRNKKKDGFFGIKNALRRTFAPARKARRLGAVSKMRAPPNDDQSEIVFNF